MVRHGLTLIELLIVVAILSLLLQMTLPAIEMSREAARRAHCANNLRQLGLAVLQHEVSHKRFPSGGWHFTWIGEPERRTDASQPGSWAFNVLDYLEQSKSRNAGSGLVGQARTRALIERTETSLPIFICPSRRLRSVYLYTENQLPFTKGGALRRPLEFGAKTDYAANAGDGKEAEFPHTWSGPQSLEQGDDPEFQWPRMTLTGIIFGRSKVRSEQVTDGLSDTYLLGEKYVESIHRKDGEDPGDNEGVFSGFNNDNCRVAGIPPQRDADFITERVAFGSSHPNVWQAVMCDGSIRTMAFDVDPAVHRRLANRSDAEIVE